MKIGNIKASFSIKKIQGEIITKNGETFYKISNVDKMRPFFISIVSNSNHWMFISSNGGVTAGRKNSNFSLFPYYTDDKITESNEITGSKTLLKVEIDEKVFLWEPFSKKYEGVYDISRNLYKNNFGNKIIFEEENHDLGLTFQYEWNSSHEFGFVKKSTLTNTSASLKNIAILDGIQNILPYGVGELLQNASSNLVDAYKRSELDVTSGVGIFALSAIIVDKAEPSEALKANTVWSTGFDKPIYLLSSKQLDTFRRNEKIQQEVDVKAEKGAYFTFAEISLEGNTSKNWMFVANVNQTVSDVISISEKIKASKNVAEEVNEDIEKGTSQLKSLVTSADGLQLTADQLYNTRHFSNTLFNIMRGGIFDNNYSIEKNDFAKYLEKANKKVANNHQQELEQFKEVFSCFELKSLAEKSNDKNFQRLCFEYLPLKFSRRHGDPSRPWNKFSINTFDEETGEKILDYEGNWRDIFQNWEALAHSYPSFIESMIHKFLNATTFDGYNPYRVTKDGFDWETIEPDNPWSYIGYWGDHQIIYLLKFLEFIENYYPQKLATLFSNDVFVYANVPYKIKSYQEILKNPKDTIEFNEESDKQINNQKEVLGADGALLSVNNSIYNVNLIEKLLAPVLAKISNFIPEGGIWMNTQRPEWNDANNALVGNGVSMVTLYYLRRFLHFFQQTIQNSEYKNVQISTELKVFFDTLHTVLDKNKSLLNSSISDRERKQILDGLGEAGSVYRDTIYNTGFSGDRKDVSKVELLNFIKTTLQFIDHSIEANKRSDNLYHAYNLMTIANEHEISISYLPEMLEGQVAVLSSGYLSANENLAVLNALKSSSLFRPDQYSYILYPNKDLPTFLQKNNLPKSAVEKSELVKELLKNGNKQIIEKDCLGNYHFNGNFNNAQSLLKSLNSLPKHKYELLIQKDKKLLLDLFEETFDHKSFTGRSGTFFGYEGLGSIYWHMVSKLLLAVQEVAIQAIEAKEDEVIIGKLLDHYYEINEGIGAHKSPELYGAIPTDPYSHTPASKGAQQPGMTGQVKEDFISRYGELGVKVTNGLIHFSRRLLREREFLKTPDIFSYVDVNQEEKSITIRANQLCFTCCQVPVIYEKSNINKITIFDNEGATEEYEGLAMNTENSLKIFNRTGEIEKIIVFLKS